MRAPCHGWAFLAHWRTADLRATQARLEEDIRQRTGNTVIYRRGTIRRVIVDIGNDQNYVRMYTFVMPFHPSTIMANPTSVRSRKNAA